MLILPLLRENKEENNGIPKFMKEIKLDSDVKLMSARLFTRILTDYIFYDRFHRVKIDNPHLLGKIKFSHLLYFLMADAVNIVIKGSGNLNLVTKFKKLEKVTLSELEKSELFELGLFLNICHYMDEPDNAYDFNSLLMAYQYFDEDKDTLIDVIDLLLKKYFGVLNFKDNLKFTMDVMDEITSCFNCISSQNQQFKQCNILEDLCSFTIWKAIFNETILIDRAKLVSNISGDPYLIKLFSEIILDNNTTNTQINNLLRNATSSTSITRISLELVNLNKGFVAFHTCFNMLEINNLVINNIIDGVTTGYSNAVEKQKKIDEEVKAGIVANIFTKLDSAEAATIGGGGRPNKSKTRQHTNKQSKKPKLNNPLLNNFMGMRNTEKSVKLLKRKSKHRKRNHNKKSKIN
jgi:hypothetical protein